MKEDKSNHELAVMYKDEGNEWLKGGLKKGITPHKAAESIHEAGNCYTHALAYVEKALEDIVEKDKAIELLVIITSLL